MKEEANDALVLRDLVPVEPLLPEPPLPLWAWIAIGLAALVLLAGVIAMLRRKKDAAAGTPRAATEEAYRRAVAELEAISGGSIQEVATRVSVTLRRYLAVACSDPALFETHEEFISRHGALEKYPEELRDFTAEGFSHLARLKYGREAKGDPAVLVSGSRQLLDRLHKHLPA